MTSAHKNTWFSYFALVIFEIFAAYAIFSGIEGIAGSKPYTRLYSAAAICVFAAVLILLQLITTLIIKVRSSPSFSRAINAGGRLESIAAACILAAGALARVWVISSMPIEPSSDYQTYYNVAELFSSGVMSGSGYGGYIAEFPHVFGYPFILSLVFRLTGPSLAAGLYFNALAGLLSAFLVYRITRLLCGRLGGLTALFLSALWPSQILYGTILASEPVFTCMLLFSIWIFVHLYRFQANTSSIEPSILLCVALGITISLASSVRPLAVILLIAIIICLAPCAKSFDINEKMLNGRLTRAACQGWFRALIITLSFFICSSLISSYIETSIGYELPGTGASFGYNLMVGVNLDSKGTWNQEDAEFFGNAFFKTNSAEAAHKASIGKALDRIKSEPVKIINLAMEKFTLLWRDDDYAAYWTSLFLEQQGRLTQERKSFIDGITPWNNYAYLISIFLSAIYGLQLFSKRTAGPQFALILLFVGTAALHMLVEVQNRYHYFMLPVFIMLSSLAVAGIFHGRSQKAMIPGSSGTSSTAVTELEKTKGNNSAYRELMRADIVDELDIDGK